MDGATVHGSVRGLSNAPNFSDSVSWVMIVAWNHRLLPPPEPINSR
jgi:hypothetical protein